MAPTYLSSPTNSVFFFPPSHAKLHLQLLAIEIPLSNFLSIYTLSVFREALNRQLLDIIRSMEEEGLVDHRLAKVHSMKEHSGPSFFATTLSTFCHDSTETLRDLTQALGQIVINYKELEELCIKMKGGASCIGGCRMANASRELWRAFQNRSSRERCATALNTTKQEFLLLKEKMDTLVELEKRIIT